MKKLLCALVVISTVNSHAAAPSWLTKDNCKKAVTVTAGVLATGYVLNEFSAGKPGPLFGALSAAMVGGILSKRENKINNMNRAFIQMATGYGVMSHGAQAIERGNFLLGHLTGFGVMYLLDSINRI